MGEILDGPKAVGDVKHLLSDILSFLYNNPLSAKPPIPFQQQLSSITHAFYSHAKLGASVDSVMMMAEKPSKALKAISLTLGR